LTAKQTRVAAYGLIGLPGRVLLCRLSASIPDFAGYWTLPGGGIDFGEDPEAAMIREVREETGLQVPGGQLLSVDSRHFVHPDRELHSLRLIFRCDEATGDLSWEEDGSTDRCEYFALPLPADLPRVELVDVALSHVQR